MSNEEILGFGFAGFFAFIAAFFFLFLIVGLIVYVLSALGLFKIAKRTPKKDLAWLAWIPIASTFLMMMVVEDDVHEGLRGKLTMVYGIAFVVILVLGSFIPGSQFILMAFFYYAFYFIAKRYSSNPVLHVVIGVITAGIGTAVSLFLFRNREPLNASVIEATEL